MIKSFCDWEGTGEGRGTYRETGFGHKRDTGAGGFRETGQGGGGGEGDAEGPFIDAGSGMYVGRGDVRNAGIGFHRDQREIFFCSSCAAVCKPEWKMQVIIEDLKYCSEFQNEK